MRSIGWFLVRAQPTILSSRLCSWQPQTVKSINEARQAEKEEKVAQEDNEPQLLGEARTAKSEVLDMKTSTHGKLTLDDGGHVKSGSEKCLKMSGLISYTKSPWV